MIDLSYSHQHCLSLIIFFITIVNKNFFYSPLINEFPYPRTAIQKGGCFVNNRSAIIKGVLYVFLLELPTIKFLKVQQSLQI